MPGGCTGLLLILEREGQLANKEPSEIALGQDAEVPKACSIERRVKLDADTFLRDFWLRELKNHLAK